MMYALIDCNNFFVSCERLFNPKIRNKAVVVLSNNDGCVVARSNEAKKLGIKMGDPIFLYKDMLKTKELITYSSNFVLYGDISTRVMKTILEFGFETEIYSIDEAFLHLNLKNEEIESFAKKMKNTIYKNCGIPVSIGVGKTKTLAKIANAYCKKNSSGICFIDDVNNKVNRKILENTSTRDIWGVGYAFTETLKRLNIINAWQYKNASEEKIKKRLKLPGYRTMLELNEIPCFVLEKSAPCKKSILCSRSFPKEISSFEIIERLLSSFVSLAAKKLRKQNSVASYITVFIKTNRHSNDNKYYSASHTLNFEMATDYTPDMIKKAKSALKFIFKENITYKKLGVLLSHLSDKRTIQKDLFFSRNEIEKDNKIMNMIDGINKKSDKNAIFFAAELIEKKWICKQSRKSQKFTTSWDELLKVTC